TADFVKAAGRLSVDLTIATEETSTFESREPAGLLTLDFNSPEEAARKAVRFSKKFPLDAVLGVDDPTALIAAKISEKLSLPANTVVTASDTLDKFRMRLRLSEHGIPVPAFQLLPFTKNPKALPGNISFPCVLKPVNFSASRGVIRADTPAEFKAAFNTIQTLVRKTPDRIIPEQDGILVEEFIPGDEVAIEGIIIRGKVYIIAIFDKPDPLDGPYFPETIYVTPSRLAPGTQETVTRCVKDALAALGIRKGPFHAELRLSSQGPRVLEIAARSIGGHCSRMFRFGTVSSLEELVIREALGMEISDPEIPEGASGVLMIPVPEKGRIREISGIAGARRVKGIREVDITAHSGQFVSPLPEGNPAYLGFIFAEGPDSGFVEEALRTAGRLIRPRINRGETKIAKKRLR
ncbi:MAG TPA: ATP-grasp domain-containing protein, partial [Nitrospiria bacterium]